MFEINKPPREGGGGLNRGFTVKIIICVCLQGSVHDLAIFPDGQYLVSAGEDRRILLWDLSAGSLVKELRGHSDSVFAFVESWKNDETDDSFHGFSLSAASVSLSISLLLVYAKNPNKIFTKHNKLRHG